MSPASNQTSQLMEELPRRATTSVNELKKQKNASQLIDEPDEPIHGPASPSKGYRRRRRRSPVPGPSAPPGSGRPLAACSRIRPHAASRGGEGGAHHRCRGGERALVGSGLPGRADAASGLLRAAGATSRGLEEDATEEECTPARSSLSDRATTGFGLPRAAGAGSGEVEEDRHR